MKSKFNNGSNKSAWSFSADYLAAKKHIDDLAVNEKVLQKLKGNLQERRPGRALEVLEVGAGIGTMLVRLAERGVFTGAVTYRLTDSDADHLAAARTYLCEWATRRKDTLFWSSDTCGTISLPGAELNIILEKIDILHISRRVELMGLCDLLIAHGMLDLFDFNQVLPSLLACLKSDGLVYFTCNFDGETIFLPQNEADSIIISCYHESMEKRNSGASQTGRRLLAFLHELPEQTILAAGSSDWIIHPESNGYRLAEKLFLHTIIGMVERELAWANQQTAESMAWLHLRRQQVEDGALILLARHLDVLAGQQHPQP